MYISYLRHLKAELCFVYNCITIFNNNFHLSITRYQKPATLKDIWLYLATLLELKEIKWANACKS